MKSLIILTRKILKNVKIRRNHMLKIAQFKSQITLNGRAENVILSREKNDDREAREADAIMSFYNRFHSYHTFDKIVLNSRKICF